MTAPTAESELGPGLLSHLRIALESPNLSYAEPLARISGGFDTLIYGFRLSDAPSHASGPLILRVFRDYNPWITLTGQERARFETAVQNAIADLRYPAPRVLHYCADAAVLGAPFLAMERLPGRIMLDLLFRPAPLLARLPDLMAESQAALHALDPAPLLRAIERESIPARVLTVDDWMAQVTRLIEAAQLEGLKPGMNWLFENRPAVPEHPVICHGDFHPLNLLIRGGKISGVIDWPWVRIADAAYDIGATVAIFTQGPVSLPRFLQSVVNWGRRLFIARYLRSYGRLRPLDMDAVRYYEALRAIGFLLEAGQQRQADAGVIKRPEKPTAFGTQPIVDSVTSRFERITRVAVSIPARSK